jgi:hypothetical protein
MPIATHDPASHAFQIFFEDEANVQEGPQPPPPPGGGSDGGGGGSSGSGGPIPDGMGTILGERGVAFLQRAATAAEGLRASQQQPDRRQSNDTPCNPS